MHCVFNSSSFVTVLLFLWMAGVESFPPREHDKCIVFSASYCWVCCVLGWKLCGLYRVVHHVRDCWGRRGFIAGGSLDWHQRLGWERWFSRHMLCRQLPVICTQFYHFWLVNLRAIKLVVQQLLVYLLTYSMEQSPSWEANWFCS